MSKTFIVGSSNGEIHAEVDTGIVRKVILYEGGDNSIADIQKFDIDEFHKYYKDKEYDIIESNSRVDILDLGYWYGKGDDEGLWEYEEPAHDWRKMMEEDNK